MAESFTDSSIVITFTEADSKFILDSFFLLSVTTVAPNFSSTSPTCVSSFCTTSATASVYVWLYVNFDTSIELSSFKLASNLIIVTLMLKNSST